MTAASVGPTNSGGTNHPPIAITDRTIATRPVEIEGELNGMQVRQKAATYEGIAIASTPPHIAVRRGRPVATAAPASSIALDAVVHLGCEAAVAVLLGCNRKVTFGRLGCVPVSHG